MSAPTLDPSFFKLGLLQSAVGIIFCAVTIPLTHAQTVNFSAGSGYTRYHYEEPGLMQLSGHLYVVGVHIIVKSETGNTLVAEGRYAEANVDYASLRSGNSRGQPLSIQEFRLLSGSTHHWRDLEFHPFIGVGVRRLSNDAQGLITTNGESGYLRVSTYKYLPLGVSVDFRSSIGVRVEYDYLLNGRQQSLIPGELIQNRQARGYGRRLSMTIPKDSWLIEPYFQRWDIAASNVVSCLGGFQLCREPKNFTTEVGVNIQYVF